MSCQMKKTCFILLLSFLLFVRCGNSHQQEETLGDVIFVTDFPYDEPLKEIPDFTSQEIGLSSIKVLDSVMVLGLVNTWKVSGLEDTARNAKCLSIGNGPGEFDYIPMCGGAAYLNENDSLIAYIPDRNRGRTVRANLTGMLNGSLKNSIRPHKSFDAIKNDTWFICVCDSSSVMLVQPNTAHTTMSMLLCDNVDIKEPRKSLPGDSISVRDPNNINMLSRGIRYSADKEMFVEAMRWLNQIQVYSKDGGKGFTLCVGDKLDEIGYIEDHLTEFRNNAYLNSIVFPEGMGFIYSGYVECDETPGPLDKSELQFFKWDGSPVYRMKLPYSALGFDLDYRRGVLYVIDQNNDRLVAYDATPIIRKYKEVNV